jgi:hypothetical protein
MKKAIGSLTPMDLISYIPTCFHNSHMRKYYYLLSILFVSISAVSISLRGQAQNANHDYLQAQNLAISAINSCYENKNLEECDKLNQIKNTLMNWCQKSNNIKSDACVTYNNVISYESVAMAAQTARQINP